MDTLAIITRILCEIMDLDPDHIRPETYVIRELEAESIDLLEIGVAMEQRLRIPVNDDRLFLKSLRIVLTRAEREGIPAPSALHTAYPHLSDQRIANIVSDLENGPVLQVADLLAYAVHCSPEHP